MQGYQKTNKRKTKKVFPKVQFWDHCYLFYM